HLPLFRARYLYLNWPVPPSDDVLRAAAIDVDPCSTFYDFTLALWAAPRGYFGRIEYDAERYSAGAMADVLEAFCALATAGLRDPERPLAELPLRDGAAHALSYEQHIDALARLA
ncbi:MAG: hypothetical protein QOI11_1537, partial [Candidatus Eremiobacteraeota bacterium]|nr:hypothetical protein [Candidatus Eremiobacteraeota bacterium]